MPFDDWLEGVRAEALARGIRTETVQQAFEGLQPKLIVVERDRTQAEFALSLDDLSGAPAVEDARARHAPGTGAITRRSSGKVAAKYGVPTDVLAAVWSIESNLGRFSGVRPTIQALATLAWEGRRAAFFRRELLDALTILDRGDVEPARLKGSWAGALGQPQFMPSTYLRYAQDFDGDGRRDIWRSLPDVFASIANFLKENGWTAPETPGDGKSAARPVSLGHRGSRAPARRRLSREARDVGATPARALDRARGPHGDGRASPRRRPHRLARHGRLPQLPRLRQLRSPARVQLRARVRAQCGVVGG